MISPCYYFILVNKYYIVCPCHVMDVLFQTHSTVFRKCLIKSPSATDRSDVNAAWEETLVLMGKRDDMKTNFMVTCDKSYKEQWENAMEGKEGSSQKIL